MGVPDVVKDGKLKGGGKRARMIKASMRKEHSFLGSSSLVPSCDLCYSKKVHQKQPISNSLPK